MHESIYIRRLYGFDGDVLEEIEEEGVLCPGCETMQPADEIFDGHCLICWSRTTEINPYPERVSQPAPLLQSEAERLHDEIVEATRQCNEWADRIEQLIEQRRQALAEENAE